jgi:hypothetical protein
VVKFKIIGAISKTDHDLAAVWAVQVGVVVAILQAAFAKLLWKYSIFNLLKGRCFDPDSSALGTLQRRYAVTLVSFKINVVSWTLHSSFPSGL